MVSRETWLQARKALLAEEKALTQAQDAVNARRRRLPMVKVERAYTFEGPQGKATFSDLFDGRRQLYVHHFMWHEDGQHHCPGCTKAAAGLPRDEQNGDWPVNSVFLRNGDAVYHTYSTFMRGLDHLFTPHNFLDLTPYGRQEDWEDSPAGWPRRPTHGTN